jgi:hypothetical protein
MATAITELMTQHDQKVFFIPVLLESQIPDIPCLRLLPELRKHTRRCTRQAMATVEEIRVFASKYAILETKEVCSGDELRSFFCAAVTPMQN